ncbi:glycoside hydrolase family 71 protein [Athelia psychrophila]|uniref:Glycoside hydrolase family 71 protein n=1 Tax=Athelia psychrophila TaxID=1759441 RepID=A0A166HSZ9_9AGAM|nr:glycoside hydrolase family 71 protein [Fibularhizoctonia sp. CBS 109695]
MMVSQKLTRLRWVVSLDPQSKSDALLLTTNTEVHIAPKPRNSASTAPKTPQTATSKQENAHFCIGSETTAFYADAGFTMGSVPFPAEDKQTPTVKINRAGTKIASGSGGISINQTGCTYYNFNPYVGSVIAK